MSIKIYHNPRCSKSRQTLEILIDNGIQPTIIEYLKETPSKEELTNLLEMLHINAFDILRKGEAIYKEQYKGKEFTNEEWIAILVQNPKLIERPIVVKNKKAVLGRPPENVLNLI